MTDYITLDAFKQRHGISQSTNDYRIMEHISAASAQVDEITFRSFGPGTAGARYFRPISCGFVRIDDAYSITQVAVDDACNGTYSTVWASTDYETDPPNGIGPNGESGWPAEMLRAVGDVYSFPTWHRRSAVKVTATWGWAAVPAAVVEATYLLTNRLYYEVAVPSGVTPPSADFGLPGSTLQRPYTAERLLRPYMRASQTIGIA